MLPAPPFLDLLENPESDEVRERYGKIEDLLDRSIHYLVHRDLYRLRRMLTEALRELNSMEVT